MIQKFSGTFLLFFLLLAGSLMAQEPEDACPKLTEKKAIKNYEMAMDLFSSKKFSAAVPYFKEVIAIEPTTAEPYYFLGYYNFKIMENYAAAENYLKKAIEICPEVDLYAYYFLGAICFGRNEYAPAVEYLKKFVEDPALVDNDADINDARDMLRWGKFYSDLYTKPVPFEPDFIRGVCSPLHEYLPSFSPDGELAFYTRVLEMPPRKDDIFQKKYYKEALFCSVLTNGAFDAGKQMEYPFNETENIGGVSIDVGNTNLFVAVGKPMASGELNVDICYSIKGSDGYWSGLEPVPGINGEATWETMPSVSSDGNTLYFVSDRPGGYGAGDIWVTRHNKDGSWSSPENLGPSINTPGDEKTPFIHTDSQTLYFTSGDAVDVNGRVLGVGLPGLGGLDIFYSRKGDDGKWSPAVNIGYPINTEKDESGFLVSTNGKIGYFTSTKHNGPGGYDVYGFNLYKEARPEEVTIIKGKVEQEDNHQPVSARIELKNVVTKKITEIPVDSITGKYAAALVFKNDYILTVKTEDYAYESKYLAKEDSTYEAKAQVDFEVKAIEVGQSYRLNDIYFPTNSAELTPESCSVLDGFIEFLAENEKIKVAIQGHTDDVGKAEDNLILSDNRAKSVYEYLILKGIAADRLSFKGYGEDKPIAPNDTFEGRARNRRTEFVIIEK